MAGFSTYSQVTSAITSGNVQKVSFSKDTFNGTNNGWFSYWYQTGSIPPGIFGTVLTARQIDNTFVGAIPVRNASAGKHLHLISVGFTSTNQGGTWILADRLLEAPLSGGTTNAVFNGGTPQVIPARDNNGSPSGDGCFMFFELLNIATPATTLTVRYTNSQGVTGRVTSSVNTVDGIANGQWGNKLGIATSNNIFLPLQAGDTGVQAVSGYTLGTSIGPITANIVVCRPLLYMPITTNNAWIERDLVLQLSRLYRVYDGSALQFLFWEKNGIGSTGVTNCTLTLAEN